jgi:hypothetical protein
MYQCGMPLSYENLKAHNSQLPFPNFNLGLATPAYDTSMGATISYQPQYIPTDGSMNQNHSHINTNTPVEEDDGFDDFVDSNAHQVQEQPKQLSEEEKRKLEEEERLKRLDLISSAFDDALFDEPEEKKEEIKQEVASQPSKEPHQIEENKVQPSDNGWANFNSTDQPNQSNTGWQNESAGWDMPNTQNIRKSEEKEDDDFNDFVDSKELKSQQKLSPTNLKASAADPS